MLQDYEEAAKWFRLSADQEVVKEAECRSDYETQNREGEDVEGC